ncbi:MAG: hypothetical protein RIG61_06370 [Deltaproteobacteria bacterium]
MAESTQNPFSEFMKIMEVQKKELEKISGQLLESQAKAQEMSKPVLEYQQRLFEESIELQKVLMENIMETVRKMLKVMTDNPMKYTGGAGVGAGLPADQFSDYVRSMQKVQEKWMEQFKTTTSMFQDIISKK